MVKASIDLSNELYVEVFENVVRSCSDKVWS